MSENRTKQLGLEHINFLMVLTLIFTTLKGLGIIDWEWVWVFAPLWIPFALFSVVIVCAIILGIFKGIQESITKRIKDE